jgi:uncharacterized OB-fold protein
MNFEDELKKGNFMVSECKVCEKIVWPPSEFCNKCLNETLWKTVSQEGIIIEFSKQNNEYFCVAEFEKSIKIMGKISSGIPEIGKKIKMINCGIRNKSHYFEMSVTQ